MSILNGKINANLLVTQPTPFGTKLSETAFFELFHCFDIAVDEDAKHAFVACENSMVIYDLSNPSHPVQVSELKGLGTSRQIAFQNSYVYITARSDGLYIIDVHDLTNPKLVSHFDTVELATGLDVNGKYCFVTCRHLGTEIIDISDPHNPQYISSVSCGEAQSVYSEGNFVYIGDWINRMVHIVDISDPYNPKKISDFAVDGYADGVFVSSGYCYVATGHHSAKLKNHVKYKNHPYVTAEMIAEGYGCGHGMEIFDVSNPYEPEFVSCVKFPPHFVGFPDTWRVVVSQNYAYVCDSYNGLFVIDVSDVFHPSIVAYYKPNYIKEPQTLSYPLVGLACSNRHVMVCGNMTGLHVLAFEGCVPVSRIRNRPESNSSSVNCDVLFRCKGQVHTVTFCGDTIIAACGNDGLYAISREGQVLHHILTEGIVHDVQSDGEIVVTAEGKKGIALYTHSKQHGFKLEDRMIFKDGNTSAREIVIFGKQNVIAVQLGISEVAFVTILDNKKLEMLHDGVSCGLLYHRHLCRMPHPEGYIGIMPLQGGVAWIAVSENGIKGPLWSLGKVGCSVEEGIAICGNKTILISNRKYAVLDKPSDTEQPSNIKMKKVSGAFLNGMPFVCGNTLILLNRCQGLVECLDITDIYNPKFIHRFWIHGHPEYAALHQGKIYIACGHAGLFRMDN